MTGPAVPPGRPRRPRSRDPPARRRRPQAPTAGGDHGRRPCPRPPAADVPGWVGALLVAAGARAILVHARRAPATWERALPASSAGIVRRGRRPHRRRRRAGVRQPSPRPLRPAFSSLQGGRQRLTICSGCWRTRTPHVVGKSMRCPLCSFDSTRVVDSRLVRAGRRPCGDAASAPAAVGGSPPTSGPRAVSLGSAQARRAPRGVRPPEAPGRAAAGRDQAARDGAGARGGGRRDRGAACAARAARRTRSRSASWR